MRNVCKTKVCTLSEYEEQCIIFNWSRHFKELDFMYSSGNGLRLSMGTAIKAKKSGMLNGVSDICLPNKNEKYGGLYIELKRVVGGVVSPEQKAFIQHCKNNNYYACVCKGSDEAIKTILAYLGNQI